MHSEDFWPICIFRGTPNFFLLRPNPPLHPWILVLPFPFSVSVLAPSTSGFSPINSVFCSQSGQVDGLTHSLLGWQMLFKNPLRPRSIAAEMLIFKCPKSSSFKGENCKYWQILAKFRFERRGLGLGFIVWNSISVFEVVNSNKRRGVCVCV